MDIQFSSLGYATASVSINGTKSFYIIAHPRNHKDAIDQLFKLINS